MNEWMNIAVFNDQNGGGGCSESKNGYNDAPYRLLINLFQ